MLQGITFPWLPLKTISPIFPDRTPDEDTFLSILDITNPMSPTLRGSYPMPWTTYQIEVADQMVSIASCLPVPEPEVCGLPILDTHDPRAPVRRGTYQGVAAEPEDVQVVGDRLYLSYHFGSFPSRSRLDIFDVSNPDTMRLIGSFHLTGSSSESDPEIRSFFVAGRFAYITTTDYLTGIISIVDVSTPPPFVPHGWLSQYNLAPNTIQVVGEHAFVTYNTKVGTAGLSVLDISNPDHPVAQSGITTTDPDENISCNLLEVVGSYAYFPCDTVYHTKLLIVSTTVVDSDIMVLTRGGNHGTGQCT